MRRTIRLLVISILALVPLLAGAGAQMLQPVTDLQSLSTSRADHRLPLLLVFTADDCPYCEQLAEEILLPMIRSGDYDGRVVIRALNLDAGAVTDFEGRVVDAWDFAQRYDVSLTPTMVLLDRRGVQLARPLVGVRNLDFYEAVIAREIDKAGRRLSGTRVSQ